MKVIIKYKLPKKLGEQIYQKIGAGNIDTFLVERTFCTKVAFLRILSGVQLIKSEDLRWVCKKLDIEFPFLKPALVKDELSLNEKLTYMQLLKDNNIPIKDIADKVGIKEEQIRRYFTPACTATVPALIITTILNSIYGEDL